MFLGQLVSHAAVISQTSCTVGSVTVQDPNSCTLSNGGDLTNFVSTEADTGYSLTFYGSGIIGGPGLTAELGISANAQTAMGSDVPKRQHGSANASVAASVRLETTGPVRQGWASMVLLETGEPCSLCNNVSGSVAGIDLVSQNANFQPVLFIVPFTLGVPFDVAAQGRVSESDSGILGTGFGAYLYLGLFEDDGQGAPGAPVAILPASTRQDVSSVPEPKTLLLFIPALTFAFWRSR